MAEEKKDNPTKSGTKSSSTKSSKRVVEEKIEQESVASEQITNEPVATLESKKTTKVAKEKKESIVPKVTVKKKVVSLKKIIKKIPTKRVLQGGLMSSVVMKDKFGDLLINISSEDASIKIPKIAAHGVGKRKASIARVWVWAKEKGQKSVVSVNGRDCLSYFNNSPKALLDISKPFSAIDEQVSNYCAVCKVAGGGVSAQSEAVRLGISKCLLALLPHMRPALKKEKLLRRDSRVVEPKKTGLRKARKKEQFSKR